MGGVKKFSLFTHYPLLGEEPIKASPLKIKRGLRGVMKDPVR